MFHHSINNYFCRSLLETSSVFWKSGRINKPHVGGYNFTENFTVDITVEILRNV